MNTTPSTPADTTQVNNPVSLSEIPSLIGQDDRSRNILYYRNTLVLEFIKDDIEKGRGITIIDTSGELIEAVKPLVSGDKLVLFDPSLEQESISFEKLKELDIFDIMQNNRCLLFDLNKGKIGEEMAERYGDELLHMIQTTLDKRAGLPEEKRIAHQLYINRVENFRANQTLIGLLSESRPSKINLHLTTESLYAFDRETVNSITGLTGHYICGSAGKSDAEILANAIGFFTPQDFENLQDNEIILRTIINQVVVQPRKIVLRIPKAGTTVETLVQENVVNAVKSGKSVFEVDLDMTPESVGKLDEIAHEFNTVFAKNGYKGLSENTIWQASRFYGCMLGEIIRTRWGGKWMFSPDKPDDPNELVLNVDGNQIFPIQKVAKRIINGPEDSLTHFYDVFTEIMTKEK